MGRRSWPAMPEGIMEDCYNLGTVKVEKTKAGGLVGRYSTSDYNALKVGIHNCYHAASVQYGAEEAGACGGPPGGPCAWQCG